MAVHHFRVKEFSALMNPSKLTYMTLELKSHALYTVNFCLPLNIFLLGKKKVRSCFHGAESTAGHPNSHNGVIGDTA